ncbi:diguanylate cyclase domain-containing protein [Pseudoduganella sp. UC29_71]|uniref:diguanylate cyclase domain-containing protein n=1 Tax=Pseudoduganella sp. UC29_71 TaxID=3350174 RepID=UPI00366DFE49
MALVLVDLGHFKRVNDTYGHDAGNLRRRCTPRPGQDRQPTVSGCAGGAGRVSGG